MIVVGTNCFSVVNEPEWMEKAGMFCDAMEFGEELLRILKSWEPEERILFLKCVEDAVALSMYEEWLGD